MLQKLESYKVFYHETSRAQVLDLLRREDKAERDANDSYSYF